MLVSIRERHCAIGVQSSFFSIPKKVFTIGANNRPLIYFELMQPHPQRPRTRPWDPRLWHAFNIRYPN